MLSKRIFASSVVVLAVTMGSAAAQDATGAGKPLPLLQFTEHKAKTARAPLHRHARVAEKLTKKTPAKRRIAKHAPAKKPHKLLAAVHRHPQAQRPAPGPAQAAQAAPQPSIWPAVDAAAPGAVAMPAPPAAAPQNVTTEKVLSDAPNDIAANGQIAQAAPAAQPNAPDPAAEHHAAAAETAPPVQSAAAKPAVRAMVATPDPAEPQAKSPVGSASWMVQVLAALGGAMAAGAVAWFLILRRRRESENAEFSETPVAGE